MGIKIKTMTDTGPYPRPTEITIECDQPSAFFCHGFIVFGEKPWPDVSKQLTRLGWTQANGGVFICPECSGRR